MQESKSYSKTKLYFSRWSRKSYAVFISLGREVKISRLSVEMCRKSLLKLNKLSMFFYEKIDHLSYAVDISKFRMIDISEIIPEMLNLLNKRDLRVLPLVVIKKNSNKYFKDNS